MAAKNFALSLALFLAISSAYADYGVHYVGGRILESPLDEGGKKISFRFTCQKDMDLIAVSYDCGRAQNPPSYKVSLHEDQDGFPSTQVLEESCATPKGGCWMTLPFNHLSLVKDKVYHLVIEQDAFRGGEHPVGVIDSGHFATVAFGDHLNLFDPRDETPDSKLNVLSFEKGRWKVLNHQPLYTLHGSGGKFQGVSYDSVGEIPVHGNGVPEDPSRHVLAGECLHPHYGFSATGFSVRVRRQGNPTAPLNCRVYSHDFMHHKTSLVFTGQALGPEEAPVSFQWVTFGFPKNNQPPSFPPECRYVVFETAAGRAVSQAPGCEDCYLISEMGNSGGLADAADLTFDGGAHLSREAYSTDGGANWQDVFERDTNVVILGPVNFSPVLPTPGPIPTPEPVLEDEEP